MKPSEKAPAIKGFLDEFSAAAFGRSRTDAIESNVCVVCQGPAVDFKDELSRKEYMISGMCQECQDKTFGG